MIDEGAQGPGRPLFALSKFLEFVLADRESLNATRQLLPERRGETGAKRRGPDSGSLWWPRSAMLPAPTSGREQGLGTASQHGIIVCRFFRVVEGSKASSRAFYLSAGVNQLLVDRGQLFDGDIDLCDGRGAEDDPHRRLSQLPK